MVNKTHTQTEESEMLARSLLALVLLLASTLGAEASGKNKNLLVNGDFSSPRIESGMAAYAKDKGDKWEFVAGGNPVDNDNYIFRLHNAEANSAEDAWKNQLVWRDGEGFEIQKGTRYEFQVWLMPGQEDYQIDVGLQKAYTWDSLGFWFRVSDDTSQSYHYQATPGEWTHFTFEFTATGNSDAPNLYIHNRSAGQVEIGGVLLYEK